MEHVFENMHLVCNPFNDSFVEIFSAIYRQTSYIRRNLVVNKSVDHSDVVGASLVGAYPTTSSFSNQHLASMD